METTKKAVVRLALQASFLRTYIKPGTGRTVLVYAVKGTPAALAAFKESQGTNYKEDTETGVPLYFVAMLPGRRVSTSLKLVQTMQPDPNDATKLVGGRFVVDNSGNVISDANKFADMILQEEAKLIAQRNILGRDSSTTTSTATASNNAIDEEVMIDEEEIIS